MAEKYQQVILLMTDSTRKDMLGCYGNSCMKTPNLDRMAEEGIRYERAYTAQPVCGPARSCIFTGTFPHSNGMITNCVPLGANVKTIGQRLTDSGIHCGYIGKWHLDGGDYFGLGQCPEGWDPDYWYDMRCYLEELPEGERQRSRRSETAFEGLEKGYTYAEHCTEHALRFLDQYKEMPFFLTVSYDEPHQPSLCPEPYCTMYRDYTLPENPNLLDDLKNKPRYQSLWGKYSLNAKMEQIIAPNRMRALFLGCNSFIDAQIGVILEKIEAVAPKALVIFTSDHGDGMGAHRLYGKGACIYEEICNIPLLIKGAKEKEVCRTPVSHADLTPTILQAFGLPVPKLLEGHSLMPQLMGETDRVNDAVFTEFTRYEIDHDGFGGLQMMRAVVTDRYKLAIHLLDSDELYDNETDPYELNNLIHNSAYAAIRDELHDRILENMNRTRDPYRGYQWKERPWREGIEASWDVDRYTRQRENEEYEPRQLDYSTGLEMTEAVRVKP